MQKVSSLVSKSRDKPSKSEDNDVSTKFITFRSGPLDREHSSSGPTSGPSDREHSSSKSEDPPRLTSKSQDILRRYTAPPPLPDMPEDNFNLNALIDGSAIRIEDYIKRWK